MSYSCAVWMSTVVRRYFVEMKTKTEIAEELEISRFKAARLIDEAIKEEYVKFLFPKIIEGKAVGLCRDI